MAAALALGASGAPPVRAADNVPGKVYENRIVGFRFRPLNEWAQIPQGTDPNDPKICGFYSDAAKYDRTVRPECDVYAFKVERSEVATLDTGTGEDAGKEKKPEKPPTEEEAREQFMEANRFKTTREVIERIRSRYGDMMEQFLQRMDEKKQKKLRASLKLGEPVEKVVKSEDTEIAVVECNLGIPLTNGEVMAAKLLAGTIRSDEYEVGVIFQIPESEWKKYGGGALASIKTLRFMGGEEVADARADLAEALAGKTGDERWLEEIKRKVTAGWDYRQTKNYLIVFHKEVKPERIALIAKQIELIRKDVYEVLFPPDRPVTAISVVRVCKDKEQYTQYGGSPSSAGYWNWVEKELVFYEDKADAIRVLNHEAFHQFIFYSVGSISPHDWFNEGHGDYFSGHDYSRSGKFVPKPFSWRQSLIKGAMGSKTYVPLKVFTQYTHEQYYGPQISQNYAQGWSLIWFLRQNKNPAWKDILPNYFTTLKSEVTRWVDEQIAEKKRDGSYTEGWKPSMTPDDVEEKARQAAYKAAFGTFDDKMWEKFEREWKDFKY